jgi:hypothetical protein
MFFSEGRKGPETKKSLKEKCFIEYCTGVTHLFGYVRQFICLLEIVLYILQPETWAKALKVPLCKTGEWVYILKES